MAVNASLFMWAGVPKSDLVSLQPEFALEFQCILEDVCLRKFLEELCKPP
jgi:hypothetical protein